MTFEEINANIDAQIEAARKAGVPALDIAMIDKLVRPLSVLIALHRDAGTEAETFWRTAAWGIGTMVSEMVLNMADKHNADEVLALVNAIMQEIARCATDALNASMPVTGRPN